MLKAAAMRLALPRIEGFSAERHGTARLAGEETAEYGIGLVSGQANFVLREEEIEVPLFELEIRFAKPFAEGVDGMRQRKVIASALIGPDGECNERFGMPQFTDDSVKMSYPTTWAAIAGLQRVFQLY